MAAAPPFYYRHLDTQALFSVIVVIRYAAKWQLIISLKHLNLRKSNYSQGKCRIVLHLKLSFSI